MPDTLSPIQRETFAAVIDATMSGQWFRARNSGERVTLASLWRRHLLERRAWRGEGTASEAHEYQAAPMVMEEIAGTETGQTR